MNPSRNTLPLQVDMSTKLAGEDFVRDIIRISEAGTDSAGSWITVPHFRVFTPEQTGYNGFRCNVSNFGTYQILDVRGYSRFCVWTKITGTVSHPGQALLHASPLENPTFNEFFTFSQVAGYVAAIGGAGVFYSGAWDTTQDIAHSSHVLRQPPFLAGSVCINFPKLSPNGSGAKADVTTDASGAIVSATVSAGFAGAGWQVNDIAQVAGGTGGMLKVTGVSSGAVTSFSVHAPGSGYPVSQTSSQTLSPADAFATVILAAQR